MNAEGGSSKFALSTRDSHSELWESVVLVRGTRRPRTDFFLRAESLFTAATYLEWIASHPDNAGLVVLPDDGGATVECGGDRRFPLASTRKVLIVGALIESGEDLQTKISRGAVERFYVPGTDGGAHKRAELDDPQVSLAEVARAALEVSDNAAADAVLDRVGAAAVDAYAQHLGMSEQDPIYSVLGEYAAWTKDQSWAERTPAERAEQAEELTGTVSPHELTAPGLTSSAASPRSRWPARPLSARS